MIDQAFLITLVLSLTVNFLLIVNAIYLFLKNREKFMLILVLGIFLFILETLSIILQHHFPDITILSISQAFMSISSGVCLFLSILEFLNRSIDRKYAIIGFWVFLIVLVLEIIQIQPLIIEIVEFSYIAFNFFLCMVFLKKFFPTSYELGIMIVFLVSWALHSLLFPFREYLGITKNFFYLAEILINLGLGFAYLLMIDKKTFDDFAINSTKLWMVINSIPEGMMILDKTGKIGLINKKAEIMLGKRFKSAMNHKADKYYKLFSLETRQPVSRTIQDIIQATNYKPTEKKFILKSQNDQERIILEFMNKIEDTKGQDSGFLILFRDITKEEHTFHQTINDQKIHSLSWVYKNIAHDFRNILTTIIGNMSLFKISENITSEELEIVQDVEDATIRARRITDLYSNYSEVADPVKKPQKLLDLIDKAVNKTFESRSHLVHINKNSSIWEIYVDPNQISQVFEEILKNSKESLTPHATVDVTYENCIIPNNSEFGLAPDNYVKIIIHDTGEGISPEYISQVFDPFFTTKSKNHHQGLGLTYVYSIVKKHNGYVYCNSEKDKYTDVIIFLPAFFGL